MMSLRTTRRGSLMVDVLLAIAVAALFSVALAGLAGMTNRSVTAARHESEALAYAKESVERVTAMKNSSWSNLQLGSVLVQRQGNTFVMQPAANEVIGPYTRTVTLSSALRDADGKISSTGVADPNTVKVTVTVAWSERAHARQVELVSYLTNWKRS